MSARVFCAVDTPDIGVARALVTRLGDSVSGIKLGLEFFIARGPEGVHDIRRVMDAESLLFLDLKLHDIPNTVAGAVRAATRCGAQFLTVHAAGGAEMMRAAVTAAREAEKETGFSAPVLLGVTVLTHMDAAALAAQGLSCPPEAQVLRLALLAKEAGLGGVVCSPREAAAVRAAVGPDMSVVVPGIRPAGARQDDQKRTMTPEEAVAAGADYLVVGRPITDAPDPAATARDIMRTAGARAA